MHCRTYSELMLILDAKCITLSRSAKKKLFPYHYNTQVLWSSIEMKSSQLCDFICQKLCMPKSAAHFVFTIKVLHLVCEMVQRNIRYMLFHSQMTSTWSKAKLIHNRIQEAVPKLW